MGQELKTYALDNAGALFPAVADEWDSCVFRLSVEMVRVVDPVLLQQAVSDCRMRFPFFYVRLVKTAFRCSFRTNPEPLLVTPEPKQVNRHQDGSTNHGHCVGIFYHGCRISIEMFHGLSDGFGTLCFLNAVLFRYLELQGHMLHPEELGVTTHQEPVFEEQEDAYRRYGKPKERRKHQRRQRPEHQAEHQAEHQRRKRSEHQPEQPDVGHLHSLKDLLATIHSHRIQGSFAMQADGYRVMEGRLPVEPLVLAARRADASITQFLAAILTECVMQMKNTAAQRERPVNICIPVNLRPMFPSGTLRNFSFFFRTHVLFPPGEQKSGDQEKEGKNTEIVPDRAQIVESIRTTFKDSLNGEQMMRAVENNLRLEDHPLVQATILPIRYAVTRLIRRNAGNRRRTLTLSNLGRVSLPDCMSEHVQGYSMMLPVGHEETHSIGVVSYGSRFSVSFTSTIQESELETRFFDALRKEGIPVEVFQYGRGVVL